MFYIFITVCSIALCSGLNCLFINILFSDCFLILGFFLVYHYCCICVGYCCSDHFFLPVTVTTCTCRLSIIDMSNFNLADCQIYIPTHIMICGCHICLLLLFRLYLYYSSIYVYIILFQLSVFHFLLFHKFVYLLSFHC